MNPLLVTFCVAILFASAVSATTPRLFVEATVSPFAPTDAYLFRTGLMTVKRQLFLGYTNNSNDPNVDKDGKYWSGTELFMVGMHWFTTRSPHAVIVPLLGGGASIGRFTEEEWIENVYMRPEDGFHKVSESSIRAFGIFFDAGLRFRVKPTRLMLATDLHSNLSYGSKSEVVSGVETTTLTIRLNHTFQIGASYLF